MEVKKEPCFSGIAGLEHLYCITDIMDLYVYIKIMEDLMIPFAEDAFTTELSTR